MMNISEDKKEILKESIQSVFQRIMLEFDGILELDIKESITEVEIKVVFLNIPKIEFPEKS